MAGFPRKKRFHPVNSGRRQRVSARHQVKRPDRRFGPAEENGFSSFGADLFLVRNSLGLSPELKSGPDVFADALVSIFGLIPLF